MQLCYYPYGMLKVRDKKLSKNEDNHASTFFSLLIIYIMIAMKVFLHKAHQG